MSDPVALPPSSDAGLPVLVGRADAVGRLTETLERLAAGQGGSLLIEGEAGIGKSLILSVANGLAAGHGIPFLTASAEELDREFPLRTADLALASAGLRRERVANPDRIWSPPAGDPVLAGVEAVLDRLDEIGAAGPLVFALDDLQWVDEASLLVVDRLSQAARQQPVLVLGASRPVPGPGRLTEVRRSMLRRGAELLQLDPLAPDDAARMAALRVGGEPGPGLRRILDSAAGNPLFIRELVDALSRHGQLRSAAGAVDVAPDAPDAPIVVSLEQAIAERISTLTTETVQLLRTAAVVGQEFDVPDLTTISGLDTQTLLDRLHEALDAGILEGAENTLRFRHGLIRDSLRESVPQAVRRGLHATAAGALKEAGAPPERIAPHLLQTAGQLPAWTAQWLAGAGSDLTYQTPEVAARLIEAALDHDVPDPRLWSELTARLARARFQQGEPLQAAEIAARVLARTEDPDLAAEMVWLTAYAHTRAADEGAAVAVIRDATERWTLSPVWAVRLDSLRALVAATVGGRLDDGESLARRALAEATELEDVFAAAHALFVLGFVALILRGDAEECLAHLDQALTLVESDVASSDLRIMLLANRANALTNMSRAQEATRCLELAGSIAERSGSQRLRNIIKNVAALRYNEGLWDEALAGMLSSVEDPDSYVPDQNIAWARGVAAMIHAYRRQPAAVRRQLAEIDELTGYVDPQELAIAAIARAILAEQEQGPAAALAILEPTLEEDFRLPRTIWLETLPLVLRLARDADHPEAAAKVREILAAPDRGASTPLTAAARLYCQALLEHSPEPGLEAAVLLSESAIDYANCLADVAELLAPTDPVRARQLLTEAVDRFEAMGAAAAGARAEARLRAQGIRLGVRGARRRPATGWAALTPTEATVADLVAEGLTNPEIASRMFLSRRTIQSHVSQILTKLEVTTRAGIARLAAERSGA